jgi:hypothetical protein
VRPLLLQFGPLFKQVRSRRRLIRLWPSTRAVLEVLCDVSPLLRSSARRATGGQAFASDASDTGGCVVVSDSPSSYWPLAGLSYFKGRSDLHGVGYREDMVAGIAAAGFSNDGFAWPHRFPEQIQHTEARAAVAGFERVLLRGYLPPCERRVLGLVDNMSVVTAFSKGRSRNVVVNSMIGRVSAISLATGSCLDLPWVPTDLQPADKGSRICWRQRGGGRRRGSC